MPFYPNLKIRTNNSEKTKEKKRRVIKNLEKLRESMNNHFKISRKNENSVKSIKIATWNIREFGKSNYKGRSFEELYYIAEILSHFDLIALQEIRSDLTEFKKLKKYLGPSWDYIATDVTDGSPGNQERMVFLFNTEKVQFKNIAGELTLKDGNKVKASFGERIKLENNIKLKLDDSVDLSGIYDAYTEKKKNIVRLKEDLEIALPKNSTLQIPDDSYLVLKKGQIIERPTNGKAKVKIPSPLITGKKYGVKFPEMSFDDSYKQFARTPFLISFQSGWLKLNLCTVHIYFGSNDIDKKLKQREEEIKQLTKSLANKAKSEHEFDKDSFLGVLGDFNIISNNHTTMDALESNGFVVPEELKKVPGSNVKRDKAYDQIAFWKPQQEMRYSKLDILGANVFDFFNTVFTNDNEDEYRKDGESTNGLKKSTNYSTWRTFKMSDHLPMWIELRTDFGDEYLEYLQDENGSE